MSLLSCAELSHKEAQNAQKMNSDHFVLLVPFCG